jgi:hypothetical protein
MKASSEQVSQQQQQGPSPAATATPPAEGRTLDPDVLEQLTVDTQTSPMGAAGLIELFLLASTRRLRAMREATEQADLDRIRFEAGILAGASSRMGASRLAQLCSDLPQRNLTDWLASLENEHGRVRCTLEAFYLSPGTVLPS